MDAGAAARQVGGEEEGSLTEERNLPERLERMAADPRYQALLRRRSRFTWALSLLMLAIFFGYILLIAFDKALLARPIGGGTMTVGIPVGIGVILAGIILTGIYVRRANRDFDRTLQALLAEHER